jgi:hypothetical protein
MAPLRGAHGAPLDAAERRLVILIKLHTKRHRRGPTWKWLEQQSGLTHHELQWRMRRLRNRRAIGFKDDVPYSTYATAAGLDAALHPAQEAA